jgi:uncharacterized membrane protein SpoIIM required for sporulation
MDLDAYVAEHFWEWRRLEQLCARWRLTADEVDELVALYQRAATHLSVVRSRSPDPALVARLSRLVLRARATVTGGRGFTLQYVKRFFTRTFPVAVYLAWRWWAGVAAGFMAVTAGLTAYVATHPDVQYAFFDDAQIRRLVDRDFAGYYSEYAAQNFAFEVWANNVQVAAICLAGGILVLPVLWMLGYNAVNLAVIGGIMIDQGRADLFFGLLAPHGLLELTAVYVAAGVGLRIGWAWISPGAYRSRTQALGETARSGVVVALGLIVVLLVSGIIEAFVTPSPLPTAVRVAIGVLALGGFLGYVIVLGQRGVAEGETGDLDLELREADAVTGQAVRGGRRP